MGASTNVRSGEDSVVRTKQPPGVPPLLRRLSLPLLTLYGLGTTIGAGIFVLIGKVAAEAGAAAPLSFIIAALTVAPTALAFAELAARYPRSAGEAVYVNEGLGVRGLPLLVGLMVVTAGTVSASAVSAGFHGYLGEIIDLPQWLAVVGSCLPGPLGGMGNAESVTAAAVITVLETGVLLFVAWAARGALGELPVRWHELLPADGVGPWLGIFGGSVLAFFAFIGFEDMVNVAEEVHDVERTMPRAMLLVLAVTVALYVLVATAAVLAALWTRSRKATRPWRSSTRNRPDFRPP